MVQNFSATLKYIISLFLPYINYCNLIWASIHMPPTLNLFYLLQKRAFVLSPFLLREHVLRLFSLSLTLGRTRKLIPTPLPLPVVQGGGGVDGTPPRSFWYVAVFRNDLIFSGKPLICLTRWGIFYGWWRCWRSVTSPTIVAILDAILDFARN